MSAGSERLERTRLAILEHIHRKEQRHHAADAADRSAGHEGRSRAGAAGGPGWYGQAREALDDWWLHHPAHTAVELARPALAAYARRKPMQYLGAAAAAGAVVMLLRPWKLISVTGVLLALAKSPQVAAMVMSALSTGENPDGDQAPPGP